uniref:Uncharacterized protein n=1 Tax=Oryza punctata TaxID=4537 RepID=A0A0E0M7N0_ORYPU
MPESVAENRSNDFVFAAAAAAVVVLAVLTTLTVVTACGLTTSPPTLPCASTAAVVTTAASCVIAVGRMLAVLSPWFYVGGGPVIRGAWPPSSSYMYARARGDLSGVARDMVAVALTLGAAALLLTSALRLLQRRRRCSVGVKKADKASGKSK